ncbi:CD3324 family protein [Konateibacter massiliensis]|uniref:CD3324 family protein n=1 Tax=Konateibacter massiliensis TaxID=2002841 RepID=UPI000C150601|nr:CD3324 family protein [Konateibacter massiliensis]
MGYRKAEEILPVEIIELIQKYVDGENIYIPRKENQRKEWGNETLIRQELEDRNLKIFTDFQDGYKVHDLAMKYFLSEKSIQRILRKMKEAS